jgi:hypothetical protein
MVIVTAIGNAIASRVCIVAHFDSDPNGNRRPTR